MGLARWGGVCRRFGVAAVVAVAMTAISVVGFAGPASADVQIQPGEFVQGGAARFTFVVTNNGPAPLTRVEMRMPEQHPIAEIYPMSVAGWAPQVALRPIDKPMTDQHGGEVTEVVTGITWWAMPGSELAQGAKAELAQSMWVLPAVDRIEVGVVETYANGTVTNSTITVALAAPPPAAAAEDPGAADDTAATEPAASSGSNLWWMFGLLVLIGALTAYALFRQRRGEPAAGSAADDDAADAAADADEPDDEIETKAPPVKRAPAAAKKAPAKNVPAKKVAAKKAAAAADNKRVRAGR
jgi:hypothetical protein